MKANTSHEKVKCEERIKTFAIFLGRIKPWVTEEDIKEMITKDIGLQVLKLVKLETKQQKFSSYRLIIPHEQKDLAYNSQNWPKYIIARKYFYKQKEIVYQNETRNENNSTTYHKKYNNNTAKEQDDRTTSVNRSIAMDSNNNQDSTE
jgi:hypothetical protein